jgi:hypothetical protein
MGNAQIINIAPKPGDLCFAVVGSSDEFLGLITEICNRIAAITDGERRGFVAVLAAGDGGLFHNLSMKVEWSAVDEPDQPVYPFRVSVSGYTSASLGHRLEDVFKKIKNYGDDGLFMQYNPGRDAHARSK